jgi:hypothetical protein
MDFIEEGHLIIEKKVIFNYSKVIDHYTVKKGSDFNYSPPGEFG